jgi:hypothetical protein
MCLGGGPVGDYRGLGGGGVQVRSWTPVGPPPTGLIMGRFDRRAQVTHIDHAEVVVHGF